MDDAKTSKAKLWVKIEAQVREAFWNDIQPKHRRMDIEMANAVSGELWSQVDRAVYQSFSVLNGIKGAFRWSRPSS